MNIAVIPARAGSKRIPGKNIKPFCGKPIIAYSIEAARAAKVFDLVLVTTDSEEIRSVAQGFGAEVPFLRPSSLSDDHTPTVPVIRHAISWVAENVGQVEAVCCIYATAPFISANDLTHGLHILGSNEELEFVLPVTTFPFPIQRAIQIEDDRIRMFSPEHELTRSQDLPEAWHDIGQFCWGRSTAWMEQERVYSAVTAPLSVPRFRVNDIDTEEDWTRAELIYAALADREL